MQVLKRSRVVVDGKMQSLQTSLVKAYIKAEKGAKK